MNEEYKDINPEKYLQMVEDLLGSGQLCHKTSHRYVHKWPCLTICTEGDTGEIETTVTFDPDLYILFDPHVFPRKDQRHKILGQILNSYSQKLYSQKDLNGVDWQGPDVYTMQGEKFRADYDISPDQADMALPNANAKSALRLCFDVQDNINWPCAWGNFQIAKGGTIAISQTDAENLKSTVQQLQRDIQNVDDPLVRADTIKKALYKEDGTTQFDIYGMKPGFRIQNYDLYNPAHSHKAKPKASNWKR